MSELALSALAPQKGDSILEVNQRMASRPCWGPWFPILASAARTATTYSSLFTIPRSVSGLILCVEASIAGTSNLNPGLITVQSDDSSFNTWIVSSTGITTAIRRFIQISPGSGQLTGMAMSNANSFVAAYLWPKWAVGITHGDASSWTYRVDGKYLFG